MKTCTKCEYKKDACEFNNSSSTYDGLYSICKSCRSVYRKANKELIANGNKAYAKANKDKIKEYKAKYQQENRLTLNLISKDYNEKNIDSLKEYKKEYYQKNKSTIYLKVKKYKTDNKDYIKDCCARSYQKNKEKNRESRSLYHRLHVEHTKSYNKAYRINNPNLLKVHSVRRRASKLERTPTIMTELDLFVMQEAANLATLREQVMGGKWHVDHVEPLQGKTVSGLHNAFNLAVVPATYNLRKSNRQVSEPWYMEC